MRVERITREEHTRFINEQSSASFLQLPEWGDVKKEWRSESIGIYKENECVGTALILYRSLPKIGRSFAYIPEGPALSSATHLDAELLNALKSYVKSAGAFLLRIGTPLPLRDWSTEKIKDALASTEATSLINIPSDHEYSSGVAAVHALKSAGWKNINSSDGFGEGQPNFLFQLNLLGKDRESLLAGFNQLWRRNIKRAEKEGVVVRRGTRSDLALFHVAYLETAARDGFIPRPLHYFERMWDALNGTNEYLYLFLAEWQSSVIASSIAIRVGDHYWYSYGASTAFGRDARGSNAVQWAMMEDALDRSCATYDLRGITPTLDPNDSHVGLMQFKVGTGGYAREVIGEWEIVISPLLARAFHLYLQLRK